MSTKFLRNTGFPNTTKPLSVLYVIDLDLTVYFRLIRVFPLEDGSIGTDWYYVLGAGANFDSYNVTTVTSPHVGDFAFIIPPNLEDKTDIINIEITTTIIQEVSFGSTGEEGLWRVYHCTCSFDPSTFTGKNFVSGAVNLATFRYNWTIINIKRILLVSGFGMTVKRDGRHHFHNMQRSLFMYPECYDMEAACQ